jgi:hypothetical protein
MSEERIFEIIKKAEKAFKRADKIAREQRNNDVEIQDLTGEYAVALRLWGYQPYMLRRDVEAQIGKKIS